MLGIVSQSTAPLEPRLRSLVTFVRRVLRGIYVHHAFDHAATMAFYFFLGTIPLLVLAGLLIGHFLVSAETVVAPLFRLLPGAASELLRAELKEMEAGSVAPVSLLGFLWLTSNGFHNLMDVFELLVHARPRPWWKQRALAVVWVGATISTLLLSMSFLVATSEWTRAVAAPPQVPLLVYRLQERLAHGWQRIGVVVVFGAAITLGVAAFYRLAVEHPPTVRRRVWAGTLAAIVLWTAVTWLFSTYVRVIGHYAIFYGSLATVAITLLWFYLSSLAFLIGAEVNAQLEGVRDSPVHQLLSSPP
jgi:membrane protein